MLDKLVVKLMVLRMWLSDDHGQDLAEYALLTGGIAVALVAFLVIFSGTVGDWFTRMGDWFAGLAPQ